MNVLMITASVCISVLTIGIIVAGIAGYRLIRQYLTDKQIYLEKKAKNKKYELYDSIDVEATKKAVEDLVQERVSMYIAYKFISNNVIYIRGEDEEEMIRDVTKNIIVDLSDLYIHYISLLYSISNSEDLTKIIYKLVKNECISVVASYNQTQSDTTRLII